MDFLFAPALLALPLVALPLVLHLLYRRKSTVVAFPTLRFIRSSVQRTAAKKRVQRWLLLACRMLLLLLLIYAVAQPVKRLASDWGGDGVLAAIVVDTSYSMLYREGSESLLDRANTAVQSLLQNELKSSRVALLRSAGPGDGAADQITSASQLATDWSPLREQPATKPLSDRIADAIQLLSRNDAKQKWLVVVSDLQSREFVRPVSIDPEVRVVLVDLQPKSPRAVAVTSLILDPNPPIPGIGTEARVGLSGRSGDARAVSVELLRTDKSLISKTPPTMASLDSAGRIEQRFPVQLGDISPGTYTLVRSRIDGNDNLPWAQTRAILLPPFTKRRVKLLILAASANAPMTDAAKFVRLALDPSEGKLLNWVIDVKPGAAIESNDDAAVILVSRWPSDAELTQIESLLKRGGVAMLLLQPGIESAWPALPESLRTRLLAVLPSEPGSVSLDSAGSKALAVSALALPGVEISPSAPAQVGGIIARRVVGFRPSNPRANVILKTSPGSRGGSSYPLLTKIPVGTGEAVVLSTQPDSRYCNLATQPLFLPLMVGLCLASPSGAPSINVELGEPLRYRSASAAKSFTIETPTKASYVVPASANDPRTFVFTQTIDPGLYTWRAVDGSIVGYSHVQHPAAEAELSYRAAGDCIPPGEKVIAGTSLEELRTKLTAITEPEPRWSGAVAIVLVLLCFEALLGAGVKWKPLAKMSQTTAKLES